MLDRHGACMYYLYIVVQQEGLPMNQLRRLIVEDMKPALGVTEPAAIALACARARELSEEKPESLVLRVNSGIYKNAFTCGIPGTSEVGNEYSAALGLVCGKSEKGLCVLEDVDETAVAEARRLVSEGRIKVELDSISSELFISATVKTANDSCTAVIRGGHTNFCHIEKNGDILLSREYTPDSEHCSPIVSYTLEDIYNYAVGADIEELYFTKEAYALNKALAQAGTEWERCTLTGTMIKQNCGLISNDVRMSAKTLACAAAEARVLGIDKAAMSITGSGTHGIICTLPLDAYCKVRGMAEDKLLRATAISYLVCMYIKEFSGKLSAFCGCGIAGGTGLACALSYLMGGGLYEMEAACKNMAASITGMICTGGNHCCCMKVMSAVDSAFNAAELASAGVGLDAPHGILEASAEKTMQNLGLIADPGMVQTERVIVDIMQNKAQ